jgi:glyoxalase family protein
MTGDAPRAEPHTPPGAPRRGGPTEDQMQLTGIHHLTAVSARIRDNHRFYTETLGMRLVKRSVNQDDVSAYHLFYADAKGSPGSDLTFFDWPVGPERRGTRSIARTALRVAGGDALAWWAACLAERGVRAGAVAERDGRLTLDFEDPEGQRLSLVDDGGAGQAFPWERSPVPAAHQIRGLGPITLSVPALRPTDSVLQQALHMRPVREYAHPEQPAHTVHVYEMGAGGPASELHVAVQPDLAPAQPGAGGVHHVAFRIPDADYAAWADRLNTLGIPNSGEVDRYWFHSLYFREPNGILFEIATDGPGFTVDEDEATLGEKVVLAPFLEPRRAEIVAKLKPID